MNNNILFHGSTLVVDNPSATIGRSELDFGPGFYLTNDRSQAEKWALTKSSRRNGSSAVVNVYSFDAQSFPESQYRKMVFPAYSLDWLDFVASSRKERAPWSGLDWIEGGIANDSVISTVDAYVDGFITAEQALGQLVSAELRHQICISNQEILDRYLHFQEAVIL